MQKSAAFLMVSVLLLGLFLMRESREEPIVAGIESSYADWIATNTARPAQPTHVTLVEINDSSAGSDHPWPWSPGEYALFLQAALPLKPDVVAIEPVLNWQGVTIPGVPAPKMQQYQKILHDFLLQTPKVVLGARLGIPDDTEAVPPLQPAPLLRNVKGDTRAIPAYADIEPQAQDDFRFSAATGFTNFPDEEKIVHKVPLVFNYRGEIVPSFTLQILIQWFKLTPDDVTVVPGSHIALGQAAVIPIDPTGAMNVDFAAPFARLGHDDLLLAVTEQERNDKNVHAVSTDPIKQGVVILARTDKPSRTLLVPSRALKSPGELCAAAVATVQDKAYTHRVTHLFDFAVIALMMLFGSFFHRFTKRKFLFLSFVILLGYLFLSMSVYSLALAFLPFVLPVGLLLLLNFFSVFSPRETPPAAALPQPQA